MTREQIEAVREADGCDNPSVQAVCDLALLALDAREVLEFYGTYSPRFHPDGFWEIHVAPGEGGEVRFGTRARQLLARFGRVG
jgi:hypothetical protein